MTLSGLLARMGREASQTVVTVDGKFIAPARYKSFVVLSGARVTALELLDGG